MTTKPITFLLSLLVLSVSIIGGVFAYSHYLDSRYQFIQDEVWLFTIDKQSKVILRTPKFDTNKPTRVMELTLPHSLDGFVEATYEGQTAHNPPLQ